MSKVVIDDIYFVTIDDLNHTLYKHDPGGYEVKGVGKKVGETYLKEATDTVVGYYLNMRQCVSKVIGLKVAEGDEALWLDDYIIKLEDLGDELGGKLDQ